MRACPCCDGSGKLDLSTPSKIRRARIALGLTGKDAAQVLGVAASTLANYEHGRPWHLSESKIHKYRKWLSSEAEQTDVA